MLKSPRLSRIHQEGQSFGSHSIGFVFECHVRGNVKRFSRSDVRMAAGFFVCVCAQLLCLVYCESQSLCYFLIQCPVANLRVEVT